MNCLSSIFSLLVWKFCILLFLYLHQWKLTHYSIIPSVLNLCNCFRQDCVLYNIFKLIINVKMGKCLFCIFVHSHPSFQFIINSDGLWSDSLQFSGQTIILTACSSIFDFLSGHLSYFCFLFFCAGQNIQNSIN